MSALCAVAAVWLPTLISSQQQSLSFLDAMFGILHRSSKVVDTFFTKNANNFRPVRLEFHYSHISKVTVIPAWIPESSAMDGNL